MQFRLKTKSTIREIFIINILKQLIFVHATVLLTLAGAQANDAYPNKPIRLLVPYSPGGLAYSFSRVLAKNIRDQLKQPVIVENKPGANQIIGVDTLLNTPADG